MLQIEWQLTTTPITGTCCICDQPFSCDHHVAVAFIWGEQYGEVCPECARLDAPRIRAALRQRVRLLREHAATLLAESEKLEAISGWAIVGPQPLLFDTDANPPASPPNDTPRE